MLDFMYKVSAFGDFTDIEPTPENMLFMVNSFKDYNMIPSIFQEMNMSITPQQIPVSVPLQRLSIVSSDSTEKILISSNRLDYEILSFDQKKLTKINEDNERILNSFKIIFNYYKKSSNRLALNTGSYIVNIDDRITKKFLSNFSNPIEFYKKDILDEWGTRLMIKDDISICGKSEKLNVITNINKAKIINQETNMISDGFQIDIDINTIGENSILRFNADAFEEFINAANLLKNKIFADIDKLLR